MSIFVSWKTSDTEEVIWNKYTGHHKTVYMLMPEGESIQEDNYQGLGVFDNTNVYEWVVRVNNYPKLSKDDAIALGKQLLHDPLTRDREVARGNLRYFPKFSFSPTAKYQDLPPSRLAYNSGHYGSPKSEDEFSRLDRETRTKEKEYIGKPISVSLTEGETIQGRVTELFFSREDKNTYIAIYGNDDKRYTIPLESATE